MADAVNKDELISQYCGITGESTNQARQILEVYSWDIAAAVESHYSNNQDSQESMDEDTTTPQEQDQAGGRRLNDVAAGSQPIASSSAASNVQKKPAAQKKFATLGDFSTAASKDDSDDDENHDLFAGGEKSGLAVQNPDDLKKRILEKAQKSGVPRPKETEEKKSHFAGPARTLGGEDAPSREIPAATQQRPRGSQRVDRTLHFWRDGFSVDDGDLYRIDDPRNADILDLIRQGRAPLHIMNVESGQEVDVEIKQHDEDYVKPKQKYKPFGGSGNRLGSPTPGSSTATMPGAFSNDPAPTTSAPAQPPTSQVDDSKPTVTLRISLGSGTRLTSRFNTDQTVGDVYDFVERAETGTRDFVLQTTFPTTELTEKSKVLGDMPEFKRGGAVVQKYV